jgi:hypothetical protein
MVDFLISYKNNFAKISRGRSRITSENGNYVVDSENITFKLRSSTTTTTTSAPTTTTTAAPSGAECCSGDLYLSGPGIPEPGCYTYISANNWQRNSAVFDNDPESPTYGERISGGYFAAYVSGDGYVLEVYDFMNFTWFISVVLTGGPSANLCPKTGTHPTGQGSTVTISCGCAT